MRQAFVDYETHQQFMSVLSLCLFKDQHQHPIVVIRQTTIFHMIVGL